MKRQPWRAGCPTAGIQQRRAEDDPGARMPVLARNMMFRDGEHVAGPNRLQDTARKTETRSRADRGVALMARQVFDQLHPNIYGIAVGLVAWFAVAAWILFDRQSDIELPLAMVSALLLMAVLVPWSLSLVWKKYQRPYQAHQHKTAFRDWKEADFAVWGSKLHGMHAAIDMLLPLRPWRLALRRWASSS